MVTTAVSPEDRVRARKKIFDDFIDVAQPAQEQANQSQRGALVRDTMAKTAATGSQSPQLQGLGSQGILVPAQNAGAQMLNTQAETQDKLNLQGALSQQGIANAKSAQAVANVQDGLENSTQRMARAVADRAFAEGMEAKKLIFHESAALADYSLNQLKKDFEAGRVTERELQNLKIMLAERAAKKKYAADEALARALQEFKTDIATGNVARAKSRILAAIEAQREALKDGVRASSLGAIISGTFGVMGTAASGMVVDSQKEKKPEGNSNG